MAAKRSRVPVALHSELTEYASLLRALRTRHALDLSAHLSQPSSGQQSEGESELSLSEDEDDQAHTDGESEVAASSCPDTVRTDSQREREGKQKRRKVDTWTRWPLLAGDIYRPEFDLIDEVQLIASHVLKQKTTVHDVPKELTSDTDGDAEEEELDVIASRVLAASTAEYLRSLLSACSALVPQVELSRRTRLAPLNWTSVLNAAAATGLVSPEALERAGLRLQALYGRNSDSNCVSDFGQLPHATAIDIPPSIARHVHAIRTVRAARERRDSLLEERIEQGDGDFLSFVGPRKEVTKKKRVRHRARKEEINDEEALVKKEELDELDEVQSQSSGINSDETDSEASDRTDEAEG